MAEDKKNYAERIRSSQPAASNTKFSDRMKELEEQNAYFAEKVEFLNLQKKRNEREIKRLMETNGELTALRNSMRHQIIAVMKTMKAWHEIKNECMDEVTKWEDKASQVKEKFNGHVIGQVNEANEVSTV